MADSNKLTEEVKQARKLRRQENRLKQRETNISRAESMHRYRLDNPDRKLVINSNPVELPKYNVGCSGWFYWHWKYSVYPESLKTSDWFKYYTTKLKTVELNAPFYSWPTINTVNSWKKQIGKKNFVYTVKVPELITHIKKFKNTKTLIKDFGVIKSILDKRMGCFLFQLPPSYHYTKTALKSIIEQLEPGIRNVVEFRHSSWWNKDVYKAFKSNNIIFCSSSGPKLPDELVKTSEEVYLRFHGTKQWYQHNYSKEELNIWIDRIKKSGAERVWAYFNNDRDGYAMQNARQFFRMLNNK